MFYSISYSNTNSFTVSSYKYTGVVPSCSAHYRSCKELKRFRRLGCRLAQPPPIPFIKQPIILQLCFILAFTPSEIPSFIFLSSCFTLLSLYLDPLSSVALLRQKFMSHYWITSHSYSLRELLKSDGPSMLLINIPRIRLMKFLLFYVGAL